MTKDKKVVFYDMDNVLAKWCEYGRDLDILKSKKHLTEGYFRNLPVVEGSIEALKKLCEKGVDVRILSSCEITPYCKKEKREWIKEFFPFLNEEKICLVDKGESKLKFFEPNAVLVDDYGPNLEEWHNNGGIAIKKVNSGRRKQLPHIISHEEIFNVLDI